MPQKHYKQREVICPSCGTLNNYETPLTDTAFEGKPRPIWANNRRLQPGERSFPCRVCQRLIQITG